MSSATMNAPSANPFAGPASSGGGGSYDLCPADNHPATLIAIIDLGTHDDEYQGQAKPDQRSFVLAWELEEKKPNGEPFILARRFNIFIKDGAPVYGPKSPIRIMLEGWRGKKYDGTETVDPMASLGKPCLMNVTHSASKKDASKVYHDVGSISRLPKNMPAPTPTHEPIAFHISMMHPPDLSHLPYIYGGSPKSMQSIEDIIAQSKERKGLPIGDGNTPYSEKVDPSLPEPVKPDDADAPF
jgi:hypothetical protein